MNAKIIGLILITQAIAAQLLHSQSVGIFLHSNSPQTPPEEFSVGEFTREEKMQERGSRFFLLSGQSVVVTPYRLRNVVRYPNIPSITDLAELDEIQKSLTKIYNATPRSRRFLLPHIEGIKERIEWINSPQSPPEIVEENTAEKGITITTSSGHAYHNCGISGFREESVSITHKDGISLIPISELSEEQKIKLNFEEKLKYHIERDAIRAKEKEAENERRLIQNEIESLKRKMGINYNFRVNRRLEFQDFPGVGGTGTLVRNPYSGIYEIVLNNELSLLLTKETEFKSQGLAFMRVAYLESIEVKTNLGFENKAKVYVEVSDSEIKYLQNQIRIKSASIGLE